MNDDQLDDLLRDAARAYNAPPETPREAMWERIAAARDAAAITPIALHRQRTRWLRTAAGIAAVLLIGISIGRLSSVTSAGPAAPPQVAARGETPATPDQSAGVPLPLVTDEEPAPDQGGSAESPTLPRRGQGGDRRLASTRAVGFRRADPGSTYGVPRNIPGVVGEGTMMNPNRLAVVEHLARTEVLLVGFRSGTAAGRSSREDAEQFGALTRELLQNTRLLLATRATDDPLLTRLLEDLELVLMQIAQYASDGGARRGDLDAINQSLDRRNVLPKLRSTIPAGAPAPPGT